MSPDKDLEVIIVDDWPADGTREKIKSNVEPHVDKVVYHDVNRGKGAALRTGIREYGIDPVVECGKERR